MKTSLKKHLRNWKSITGAVVLLGLIGCRPERVTEERHLLPSGMWHIDSVQHFSFFVPDASVPYDLWFKLRYNQERYPYYNLFTFQSLSDSTGQLLQKDMRREWILFDPKTGVPKGKGLGGNYFLQERLIERFHFPKKGTYTLHLRQNMREDSLSGISSVGVGLAEAEEAEEAEAL